MTKEDRQSKAIAALLSTSSTEEAARVSGIASRTIRAYMADPEFQKQYTAARAALIDGATTTLQRNMQPVVDALASIALNDESNDHARVSAARAVLDYGLKYTEMTDIAARLEALEAATDGR